MKRFLKDLMVLTKLRINLVGVFTGYAAIAVWRWMHPENDLSALEVLWCLLALLLIGGAANTCNQIIEKNRDARMERTKDKRPLPSGRMSIPMALLIAIVQAVGGTLIFELIFESRLATWLGLGLIAYYAIFYTWFLKPRHYLNIVIGGVPGAMGPLLAWAAVDGSMAWEPVVLFGIIFLWTPPHFWALAIRLKEDYAKAGIPMLPVAKGVDETTKQIFIYTVVMVVGTLTAPALFPAFRAGIFYTLTAVLGGAWFLWWAWKLWRERPVGNSMALFHYSILYIGLLFTGVTIDALISGGAPS